MGRKDLLKTALVFPLMVISMFIIGSCSRKIYVPIEKTSIDTIYKNRTDSVKWIEKTRIVDSVRWRDSVSTTVDENGNVKRIDTWHWRDRTSLSNDSLLFYKLRLDSVLHSKVDSVPKPYPVNKYVEKKLSSWQSMVMKIGYAGMIIIILALVYAGIKLWSKFNISSIISKIIKR